MYGILGKHNMLQKDMENKLVKLCKLIYHHVKKIALKNWNTISSDITTALPPERGGKRVMKKQTHIIWQARSQGALLLSMAGRQNGSFQPPLLLAEVTWDHWGIAILGSVISQALLLIRNILFCFHGDRHRGRQWRGAESTSLSKNVRLACLLGQSRGCSLLHPRVMGQVLVSAPPGCNNI